MTSERAIPIRILLVEDNDTHAHVIERQLKKAGSGIVVIERCTRLELALEHLKSSEVDILLLDLSLPDSELSSTLPRVIDAHSEVPVIVLTSIDDIDFATRAVSQGAQDYLLKSDINGPLLMRSIHYAIERKKTQERLESYAAELESSNERLKGFAHSVAHEVKSPLTVVSACLQMLEQEHTDQLNVDLLQHVEDANAALRGLTAMVNELLDFSQMGANRPNFEEVDLEASFYHAYVCLRPAIKSSGAVITHDPLPTIYGNEVQLRQLLLNLIGNAIKYRSERKPEIHLGAEAGEDQWIFRVADNGMGISAEDRERIFDPFVRVNAESQIPGTGIGLALCQRIVEHHAGRIWVEPNKGPGSTFVLIIPKKMPDTEL
jgi:signal transduction histidine kinase